MAIPPISNSNTTALRRNKLNPVSTTGYGSLLFGTASVIAASNKKMKAHKYLGYIAGALAFLHTGIILGLRNSKK